jgi:hypothetical protein
MWNEIWMTSIVAFLSIAVLSSWTEQVKYFGQHHICCGRRDEVSKGRGKRNYLKEHRVAISEMSTSLHAQKQVISSTFLSCWWQLPKCIEQNIAGAGEIHCWFKKSFQFWTLTFCRFSCIILYGRWYIPQKFERQVSLILSFNTLGQRPLVHLFPTWTKRPHAGATKDHRGRSSWSNTTTLV